MRERTEANDGPSRNALACRVKVNNPSDKHNNSPWKFYMTGLRLRRRFRWCFEWFAWTPRDWSTARLSVVLPSVCSTLLFLEVPMESVPEISPPFLRNNRVEWTIWSTVHSSNVSYLPSENAMRNELELSWRKRTRRRKQNQQIDRTNERHR